MLIGYDNLCSKIILQYVNTVIQINKKMHYIHKNVNPGQRNQSNAPYCEYVLIISALEYVRQVVAYISGQWTWMATPTMFNLDLGWGLLS